MDESKETRFSTLYSPYGNLFDFRLDILIPASTVIDEITSVDEWIASATRATEPDKNERKALMPTRSRFTTTE
jgi:hypothetical protein